MKNEILFQAIIGSHNYNLDTEKSDKDYKLYVIPTFDDLYYKNAYSEQMKINGDDYDVHDIRKLKDLLIKSNVNFIECLFSIGLDINMKLNRPTIKLLCELINMREEIARMNLRYLYKSSFGMYKNKLKYLEKGTKNTKDLVDNFGYDTKSAMAIYRILDFLKRYADRNFENFRDAICYSNKERKEMLDILYGKYNLNEFKAKIEALIIDIEENYKDLYLENDLNKETEEKLENILKEIVKLNIG